MTYLWLILYLSVLCWAFWVIMGIIGFTPWFIIIVGLFLVGFELKLGNSIEIQINGIIPEVKKFLVVGKQLDEEGKALRIQRKNLKKEIKQYSKLRKEINKYNEQ